MLLDYMYVVPTNRIAFDFKPENTSVWLFEYHVESPFLACLTEQANKEFFSHEEFCRKFLGYVTHYVTKRWHTLGFSS